MESFLESNLNWKNEVKSVTSVQIGNKHGFVMEIDSHFGKFYVPLQGFRTRDLAVAELRRQVK